MLSSTRKAVLQGSDMFQTDIEHSSEVPVMKMERMKAHVLHDFKWMYPSSWLLWMLEEEDYLT